MIEDEIYSGLRKFVEDLQDKGLKTKVKIEISNKPTSIELLETVVKYGGQAVLIWILLEFLKWYLSLRRVALL